MEFDNQPVSQTPPKNICTSHSIHAGGSPLIDADAIASKTKDNLIIRVKGFKGEPLPSMILEQPTQPSLLSVA
jgi:hypothetical protein